MRDAEVLYRKSVRPGSLYIGGRSMAGCDSVVIETFCGRRDVYLIQVSSIITRMRDDIHFVCGWDL